jgi:hypothetical protein
MKDVLTDLFQQSKIPQVCLSLLFLMVLVMDYPIPYALASLIDTIVGKIVVVLIAIIVFLQVNPIVGVLGFLVAFHIIVKSSLEKGSFYTSTNTEDKKTVDLSTMNRNIKNQQVNSLEHEVIREMAPTSNDFAQPDLESVKAISDNIYDASPVE